MNCPKCNKQLEANSRFCPNCGEPISRTPVNHPTANPIPPYQPAFMGEPEPPTLPLDRQKNEPLTLPQAINKVLKIKIKEQHNTGLNRYQHLHNPNNHLMFNQLTSQQA